MSYDYNRTKVAGGTTLEERQRKVYEDFIEETGKILPKTMEGALKSMVKLAIMKPRASGLKYQLSFDGYLLEGGRGERMPDFIGRVVIEKTPNMTNFMGWKVAVSRVGQPREEEGEGHVSGGHTPEGLAYSLSSALKRIIQSTL